MNAVLGLKESVCDFAHKSWTVKAARVMNAVLGLKESVCDFAQQSRAVKAESAPKEFKLPNRTPISV